MPSDPTAARMLLGEAIDNSIEPTIYHHSVDFYDNFASKPELNLDVLRMLIALGIDDRSRGGALMTQIERGRLDNVRTLLEMGADPNSSAGWRWLLPLQVARLALHDHGEVALAITRELLAHGADPRMLETWRLQPTDAELLRAESPLFPAYKALLDAAAKKYPLVRIDFVDMEPSLRSGFPDFARFTLRNAGDQPVDLGLYKDEQGFVILSPGATLEERLPPGAEWHITKGVGACADLCRTPFMLAPKTEMLVRVPLNLLGFDEAPAPAQFRLKVGRGEGAVVSAPFSLHGDGHVVPEPSGR